MSLRWLAGGAGALLAVLALAFSPGHVTAAGAPKSEYTLTDLGLTDQVQRGGVSTLSLYFPGPGRYSLGGDGLFTLSLNYAQVVDPATSMVSVVFNGIPLRTWPLVSEQAAQHEVSIAVPLSVLREDVNLVEVRFFMQIPGTGCGNSDHPSLYATVFKQTRLSYTYAPGPVMNPLPPPDLSRFPITLLDPSPGQEDRLVLVVPDDPSQAEWQAAVDVGAAVGRYGGSRHLALTLLPAREADAQLAGGSSVVIGRPRESTIWQPLRAASAQLPFAPGAGATPAFTSASGEPVAADQGVLMELDSPWNRDYRTVVVTGASDEAVLRAALALAGKTARQALHGNAAVVTQRPTDPFAGGAAAPADGKSPLEFSLEDLGFADQRVDGWGTHRLSIPFEAPFLPVHGAHARIVYDHTRLLNGAVSSVTLALNDLPLRDTSLADTGAGRPGLEVDLPASILRTGRNVLSVQFHLSWPLVSATEDALAASGGFATACTPPPSDLAWAVLYAASSIQLPPGGTVVSGLAALPFPFVQSGRTGNLLVVAPDDAGGAHQLAALAAYLGRTTTSDLIDLSVTTGAAVGPAQSDRNMLVFGQAAENRFLMALAEHLPLQLTADGRVLQAGGAPLVGVRDGAELGILELMPSPLNRERSILVITGTSPTGIEHALGGLEQGRMLGNVATIEPPLADSTAYRSRSFDVPAPGLAAGPSVGERAEAAAPWAATAGLVVAAALLFGVTGRSLLRARRRSAGGPQHPQPAQQADL